MPDKPIPKPKQFLKTLDLLNSKAAANTLSPKTYADLVGQFAQKAYKNDEISFREYMNIVKPLFGKAGEIVTEKIKKYEDMDNYAQGGRVNFLKGGDTSYNKMVTEMYIKAGGQKGTGMDIDTFAEKYFKKFSTGGRVKYSNGSEDYGDLIDAYEKGIDVMPGESLTEYINRIREAEAREKNYASGGRVRYGNGSKPMTKSERWMRDYFFSGKGGYDDRMSYQEFAIGPGQELFKRFNKKNGGVIYGKYAKQILSS